MEQIIDKITFERKPIKWLFDQQNAGYLTIDNTFQRRYVWVPKNKIQLIESIINGYPIPEIYLWERETDPVVGTTIHSIIDGQQRLGSIFDFLNGKFKLQAAWIEEKERDYKNKSFFELDDDQKSRFWKYPLAVRFVKDIVEREEIVQMFLRLNKTDTNLNPQELRNAEFEGLFLELSQKIADNGFWTDYKIFTQYDFRRMLDIQFVSGILIFFRFGFDEEITQASINRAYDMFNDVYSDYENDKTLFETLISYASQLLVAYPLSIKLFQKKVHLYTLFTTLYFYNLKYGRFTGHHIEYYGFFATNYDNKAELVRFFGKDKENHIEEYKRLASEGTNQRSNRQRRFEIIKELTEKEIV